MLNKYLKLIQVEW